MHWLKLESGGDGIFAYLKDDRVFQIEISSNRYIDPEEITFNTSIEKVLEKYDSLQGFELMHSAGEINGGGNLWYLIEQSKGIAFEMYYNKKEQKRKVWSVIVFESYIDFVPEGCISPPQNLVKINDQKLK